MIEIEIPENLIPPQIIAQLGEKQLNSLAKNLADLARGEWKRLAMEDQSSLRGVYLSSIQKPVVHQGTAVVSLVGSVANMLEHGSPEMDLRDTLLGPNVPTVPRGERGKHEVEGGEGEYYRPIPFRHATPGATGEQVGQEMGSAYQKTYGKDFSKQLGREVYEQAIELKPTISKPGYGAAYGGRLEAGWAPKLKDHHKTDIYAGMIKEEKEYDIKTQPQYITFRTISTHVTQTTKDSFGKKTSRRVKATQSWIRKPIIARKYAEQVAKYIADQALNAAKDVLEGAK